MRDYFIAMAQRIYGDAEAMVRDRNAADRRLPGDQRVFGATA